ncbi:hypothetical protein FJZ23_02450 [Candidatus Parcubacteria bacterium]|nr:hypothetical protein [Candidatus Parcubacteria bacterium]
MRSRLSQARSLARQLPQTHEETEDAEEAPFEERLRGLRETLQGFHAPGASAASRFNAASSIARRFHALQADSPGQASASQEAARAAAKKAIPKAALFIINFIAGALEIGTAGIALLVTFLIRFLTLGWYNAEMIYGGWIMKGKHMIIGPLTWDPIPVPGPKPPKGENATIPMMAVLMTDLLVVMAVLAALTLLTLLIAFMGMPIAGVILLAGSLFS